MVKGISRQVIMVRSPDPQLFEQAIFILKDSAVKEGITDEMLLKEAKQAIGREKKHGLGSRLFWAFLGAALAGGIFAVTLFL